MFVLSTCDNLLVFMLLLLIIFIVSKFVLLQHHYAYLCNFVGWLVSHIANLNYIFDHIEWCDVEDSFTNWISHAWIVSCILKFVEIKPNYKEYVYSFKFEYIRLYTYIDYWLDSCRHFVILYIHTTT